MDVTTQTRAALADNPPPWRMPPEVAHSLARVRDGIRTYVWLEGVIALVCLVGAAFWVALAIDWVFEPSRQIRLLGWCVLFALAVCVIYKLVISRLGRRLSDAELALILERRFPELHDSLLTVVELQQRDVPGAIQRRFVEKAGELADTRVAGLPLGRVFDRRPLVRRGLLSVVLCLSVLIFALTCRDAFAVWLERLSLSPDLWPRRVHKVVDGFEARDGGDRVELVARDGRFDLIVRADLSDDYQLPDRVEIRYRLADGRRGRAAMSRLGQAVAGRHAFQEYRYQFKTVTTDLMFDVVGGDARVEDLQLRVVERPRIVKMELDCEYPAYLERPPLTLQVSGSVDLPEATRVTLVAQTNKPLHRVVVAAGALEAGPRDIVPPSDATSFRLELPPLATDQELSITLEDVDGIVSQEPYRLSIVTVADEPPQVNARLVGVRTSITTEARIPLAGLIRDDHRLRKIWFEYRVDQQPSQRREWKLPADTTTSTDQLETFDLLAYDDETNSRLVLVEVGQRLSLTVAASDYYDLADEPRHGTSPVFQFDIVTPAQLRALLEQSRESAEGMVRANARYTRSTGPHVIECQCQPRRRRSGSRRRVAPTGLAT